MPFGSPDSSSQQFWSGANVTADRTLDTVYTNGGHRRLVFASVICTGAAAGKAYAGLITTLGGREVVGADVVGMAQAVIATARFEITFPVDPWGTYSITSDVGVGASVALFGWLEVDL